MPILDPAYARPHYVNPGIVVRVVHRLSQVSQRLRWNSLIVIGLDIAELTFSAPLDCSTSQLSSSYFSSSANPSILNQSIPR